MSGQVRATSGGDRLTLSFLGDHRAEMFKHCAYMDIWTQGTLFHHHYSGIEYKVFDLPELPQERQPVRIDGTRYLKGWPIRAAWQNQHDSLGPDMRLFRQPRRYLPTGRLRIAMGSMGVSSIRPRDRLGDAIDTLSCERHGTPHTPFYE